MDIFDVVVIGAGPGGYPAAIRAAQLGASVAIVEREALGGTCLNWGCIPTKALIGTADIVNRINHAQALGISVQGVSVNYAAMIAHKNKVVAQLTGGVKQLLAANGVKHMAGVASFRDRGTIALGDGTLVGARKIIIATGSTSFEPNFLPRHARVVESRRFLELERLPGRLLVLGGGFIGCELACLAALLGAKVTIVELLEDVLLQLDPDVRREVRTHMDKRLGIRIRTGRPLEDIRADDGGIRATSGGEMLEGDLLLSAVGRRPVTEGLCLENIGLKVDPRGFVEVDDYGRTRVPNVFAVGDVTGKTQLAHFATSQGITAAENACGGKLRRNETLVPNVIFTSPEIGTVGLGEEEAKRQGREVKTGVFHFRGLGRALAVGETVGFVKWIVDAGTDQLLGAAAVGAHATELIAEATLAIRAELTAREVARTIHAHPTFSELWMEAAHAVHGEAIHAHPLRR